MTNIFFTGCTGQLGSYLIKIFLMDKPSQDRKIFLLMREENKENAKEKLIRLLRVLLKEDFSLELFNNIEIILGNVVLDNLGLLTDTYEDLLGKIDVMYHCAALTDFSSTIDNVRTVNVLGTKNIIKFVEISKKIKIFNYISSIFVAGNYSGIYGEKDFDFSQKFNNAYERSKFEAELEVRRINNRLIKKIYRPSIVVGEFATGETLYFQMFYQMLRLLCGEIYKKIPANPQAQLNLVPVDVAAQEIYILANEEQSLPLNVYHIISPNDLTISHVIDRARQYFGFREPELILEKMFRSEKLSVLLLKGIEPYIPYLNLQTKFKSSITRKILEKANFL